MTKTHADPEDKDIDCTLFRQLQVFLIEHEEVSEFDALEMARDFMRNYWIPFCHTKYPVKEQS
jgi:hypothetical protein